MTRPFIIFVAAGLSAMPVYAEPVDMSDKPSFTITVGANVTDEMRVVADCWEGCAPEYVAHKFDDTDCQLQMVVLADGSTQETRVC